MREKRILIPWLFVLTTLLFVRCTEETKEALDGLDDVDIQVVVTSIQDGSEAGSSAKFKISLQDSNQDAVTNSTGEALSTTATFSGTAEAADFDTDFVSTVSIPNGSSSTTVELTVKDDADVEGEETLILTLSAANFGTLNVASATAKIIDNDEESTDTPTSEAADISVLKDHFYHTEAVTFDFDDTWVTITAKDLPDHVSMYYEESNDLYEAYDEPDNADFKKNPNSIGEQNNVFKIPRYPAEASVKEATPMGAMGVTINSVSIFNQEAAPGDDILDELNTFDQYEGHPAGTEYHYHIEPVWLTQFRDNADNEALVGILLDGFPVYGTHEDGVQLTNDDLDDYHGHFGVTDDFPNGIYHYHITDDLPWINGDGFYGSAGTVTK